VRPCRRKAELAIWRVAAPFIVDGPDREVDDQGNPPTAEATAQRAGIVSIGPRRDRYSSLIYRSARSACYVWASAESATSPANPWLIHRERFRGPGGPGSGPGPGTRRRPPADSMANCWPVAAIGGQRITLATGAQGALSAAEPQNDPLTLPMYVGPVFHTSGKTATAAGGEGAPGG
jgi:hypothetical protein